MWLRSQIPTAVQFIPVVGLMVLVPFTSREPITLTKSTDPQNPLDGSSAKFAATMRFDPSIDSAPRLKWLPASPLSRSALSMKLFWTSERAQKGGGSIYSEGLI